MSRFVRETSALSETLTSGRVKVTFSASASPDGDSALNSRLSSERLRSAIAALVGAGISPDFFSAANSSSEFVGVVPLETLGELVEKSSSFDAGQKVEIRDILGDSLLADDGKIRTLKVIEDGSIWKILSESCFPSMRSFRAIVHVVDEDPLPEVVPSVAAGTARVLAPLPPLARASSPRTVADGAQSPDNGNACDKDASRQSEESRRRLTLKTNAPFWALMIANAGVELDLTENLSFNLPVYFGTLDYFTGTVKFRTFLLQPELRWNFTRPEGLFLGAHFGLCYFNFAVNGNYRIQDRGGKTPMLGGGLTLGYKLHFREHPRWGVEFALGAGAYRFDYDRFVNEDNGPYVDTINRTYIGPDNASVSFFYEFDLGRGKRK